LPPWGLFEFMRVAGAKSRGGENLRGARGISYHVQLFGPDAVRTFSHFLRLTISFGQPALSLSPWLMVTLKVILGGFCLAERK